MTTDLAVRNGNGHGELAGPMSMPVLSMQRAVERRNAMVEFVKTIMQKDVDYGKVPGTDKDTLYKPGAEKLNTFFGLTTRFEIVGKVEDWGGEQHGGESLFYYQYRCQLYRGDSLIAESDGSCNSRESKYRWRWVRESELPPGVNKASLVKRASGSTEPVFAVEKKETAGKYGKPAAYWQRFEAAIADGTARQVLRERDGKQPLKCWQIDDVAYRVPNEDVASQVNTIQKMAQKRALVGTTLLAVNASEFFTQDVEDMDYIDPAAYRDEPPPAPVPAAPPTTALDPFVSQWRRDAVARGSTLEKADKVLRGLLAQKNKTLSQVDAGGRGKLLENLAAGRYDAYLRNPAVASEAQQAAPDAPVEGEFTGPDDGDGGADDAAAEAPVDLPTEAAARELEEALGQDWEAVEKFLIDAGFNGAAKMPRSDARKAIGNFVKLKLGKAGRESEIPLPKLLELYHGLREGRVSLGGAIAPATA